jgi:hypothetical protein
MKKFIIIIVLAVFATMAFSSCRKCKTCTAYYRLDNTEADQTQYCGFKRVVDSDVSSYESIWNDSDFYASCH